MKFSRFKNGLCWKLSNDWLDLDLRKVELRVVMIVIGAAGKRP